MDKTKAIMLLDDNSKHVIKTNVSEFSLHNILFVNNLGEITDEMLQDTKSVIILEGFLKTSTGISDLKLFRALEGLEYTYLGQDERLIAEIKSLAYVFRTNIVTLDYETVESALYHDVLQEKVEVKVESPSISFAKLLCKNSSDFDKRIVELANEFLSAESCISDLNRQLESIRQKNMELSANNVKITQENIMLTDSYREIIDKAFILNKTLKEYEHVLTKDVYTKLKLHNYPNRPQIIYLKEYETLIHLYSFIDTLFEVFRIQGKKSVKVLQLFDSVDSTRVKAIPDYYTLFENSYLIRDVINQDFICKIGDYTNILDTLLTNRSGLDVLILVDCKRYDDTVFGGSFLQLNMCRNANHLDKYGLIPENTIVNNCELTGYMSWDHINNYKSFNTEEERFLYLSSQDVIQNILGLSQIFQESV